jgi:hypothetical protein
MQHVRLLKLGVAAFIAGMGAFTAGSAAAADDVNMWDGQWHADAVVYGWVPFIYPTVQLPPAAGGGTDTPEIQPSQYVKHIKGGVLFDGSVRKGDWSIWTDLVFLNLQASPSHTKEIGLPGGLPTLPVIFNAEAGLRAAVWTLAPSYTVMNNDIGTLDILAGIRYVSMRVNFAYDFTAPPTNLNRGGGLWPQLDTTDGIVGVKGTLRLSQDGKWYLPYEADGGAGTSSWNWNAFLGVGYHFHWGDLLLGGRNLTYHRTGEVALEQVRMTGPFFGAAMRW